MTDACEQIVVCGHCDLLTAHIAKLIRQTLTVPSVIRDGSALAVKLKPNAVTITHWAKDILAINHIGQTETGTNDRICYVLAMSDPRQLLVEQDSQGRFIKGFDRELRTAANGVPTYSDPGILLVQKYIDKAASSRSRTIVLREEDIVTRADLVGHALSWVTGIPFRRSLAKLVAEDQGWRTAQRPLRNGQPDIDQLCAERVVRQFRLAPDLFGVLQRWGYARNGEREWFDALAARAPAGTDDTPGIIVGFYTAGTQYEVEARRLAASIEKLGLALHLEVLPEAMDWLAAVRQKPIVLQHLRKQLRGPLLYVDVDAVVHSNPWPYLRGYSGDAAVSGHRDEQIISGTLLLNDTQGAQNLIEAWIAAQAADPSAWDQHALQAVVLPPEPTTAFHVDFLPPEMCKVFDRRYNPPVNAVIEHLQASRERFAGSGEADRLERLARRHARIAEIERAEPMDAGSPGQLPASPPLPEPRFADLSKEEPRLSPDSLAASR